MYPGTIKHQHEDWHVREISPQPWSGTGEHAYFYVRKQGLNTADLVRETAQAFDVPRVDVGYAGRKDKHGITEQWLSVRTPRHDWPDIDQTRCLKQTRHASKLRIGQLRGNCFAIVLRDTSLTATVAMAQAQQGFANAFGPQRLSSDNVEQAQRWLAGRERAVDQRRKKRRGAGGNRHGRSSDQQGWHLSVLRSFLFNTVLEKRCEDYPERPLRALEGDVLTHGFPSAPLWGRGRSATSGLAREIEARALVPHAELCDALEHTGVQQARRTLWVKPGNLSVSATAAHTLRFEFFLPAGSYATALLAQLTSAA